MAEKRYSRRDLFRAFSRRVGEAGRRSAAVTRLAPGLAYLRPPGFSGQNLDACAGCSACTEACPRDAILPLTRGATPDQSPVILPAKAPCVLCDELPCISACPAEVLLPVPRLQVRMATAFIVDDLCRHARGQPCLDCYQACPLPGIAMRSEITDHGPQPRIVEEGCTGCGNCLYHCPEEPLAVRMLRFSAKTEAPASDASD